MIRLDVNKGGTGNGQGILCYCYSKKTENLRKWCLYTEEWGTGEQSGDPAETNSLRATSWQCSRVGNARAHTLGLWSECKAVEGAEGDDACYQSSSHKVTSHKKPSHKKWREDEIAHRSGCYGAKVSRWGWRSDLNECKQWESWIKRLSRGDIWKVEWIRQHKNDSQYLIKKTSQMCPYVSTYTVAH